MLRLAGAPSVCVDPRFRIDPLGLTNPGRKITLALRTNISGTRRRPLLRIGFNRVHNGLLSPLIDGAQWLPQIAFRGRALVRFALLLPPLSIYVHKSKGA